MEYKKIVKSFKEYAGESFSQSILKDGGATWKDTETAIYTLYDEDGIVSGVSGSLAQSSNKKSIGFMISKTSTIGLIGEYKVLVDLGDSEDANKSDVIAEYNIEFMVRKA